MYEAFALSTLVVLVVNTLLALFPAPKILVAVAFLTAGGIAYVLYRDLILACAVAGFANVINVLLTHVGKPIDAANVANLRRTLSTNRIPTL